MIAKFKADSTSHRSFDQVEHFIDFPKLEHKILKFWTEKNTFKKLLELNKGKKRWSFIDGPITANNPMGVHHARGRTYKDFFRRYKSMRGYYDRYQNGFDVQGLWVEVEVEKELGFKSKRDIETLGIAEFVKCCKQRALRYAAKQVEQSIRLGYWMNWDDPNLLRYLADCLETPDQVIKIQGPNAAITGAVERIVGKYGTQEIGGSYFTFSDENNYMIWTFLKKCHERGWIYKGSDVMPWCPRCSTAISEHEIATEGYRELSHDALTIKFPLKARTKEFLLVWTTTPWTLSSNVAAAVHPDFVYVKMRRGDEILYLAKAAVEKTIPDKHKVLEEVLGRDLEGWVYEGPFDELESEKSSGAVDKHKVILWEDVSETEGTGIVHIAPGCGKEDLELSRKYNLPAVAPLDEFGVFLKGFGWLTGMHVYETTAPVIRDLEKKGLLFKVEKYSHRYPVCWRCESELVFRLVDEWFVKMGDKLDKPFQEITEEERKRNLRYQIMESATQVRWIPQFGLLQELDWLQNMEDWMISKKRYWGLVLPIWACSECANFEVVGSKEELKELAVEGWEIFKGHTPHRPWVDMVKIKCSKCGAVASRIPDVGNPWLDAGIVAYSTLNYRHDHQYWKKWFPAEFICESLPGQFRNWFYAMLAMSTVLEGRTSFKTCLGHGDVYAADGRPMHKSWGNAIWFDDAVENMGADVMRWMFLTSRPESNLLFGYKKAGEVRKRFLIPLWNIYSFFVTYAILDNWTPKNAELRQSLSPLDRWILSKLNILIQGVTRCLDDYGPYEAAISLEKFVNELSTWYVRRSRRRFWKSERDEDKKAAYATLYSCLTTLVKLLAPFIPFTTEEMYQNIVCRVGPDVRESVHHNDWPLADETVIDKELITDMDLAIKVCSLGRSARSKAGIKLRQPLSEAKVVGEETILERIKKFENIIIEELNVKNLTFTSKRGELTRYTVHPLPKVLGKKFGKLFPKICEALAQMDQNKIVLTFQKGFIIEIEIGDQGVKLQPEEVEISTQPRVGYSLSEEDNLLIGVNTIITGELKKEGLARDIIRRIQNQRKEANFSIADLIETYYEAGPELIEVFKVFEEFIAAETLSTSIRKSKPPNGAHIATYNIKGKPLTVGLVRVKNKPFLSS